MVQIRDCDKNFNSGTEQEFYNAYNRHKDEGDRVSIMFYFKDAPLRVSDIDADQISLIQKFKKEIGALGGIRLDYSDLSDFKTQLRLHLSREIQAWSKSTIKSISIGADESSGQLISAPKIQSSRQVQIVDEPGFLELVEDSERSMLEVTPILEKMTVALGDFSQRITIMSEQLNSAEGIADKKRITNEVAAEMDVLSDAIGVGTRGLADRIQSSVRSITDAVYTAHEISPDGLAGQTDWIENVKGLSVVMMDNKPKIEGFSLIISSLPRLTTKLNHAKRRLISNLGYHVSETGKCVSLLDELYHFVMESSKAKDV